MTHKALTNVGAVAIRKEEIPAVIETVSKITGIASKDLHPLGSTGLERSSGDVDLAIDSSNYAIGVITERLTSALGQENHYFNHGTKIHSFAVPNQHKVVQVDLMFTAHVDWAKFAFYSDGVSNGRTAYKGAIRSILLRAAASCIEQPGIDFQQYLQGELIVNAGRTFDMTKGLRRIYQFRPLRKVQSPERSRYIKRMTNVETLWDLRKARPCVPMNLSTAEIVITDPTEAVRVIFPGQVTVEDVCTAEQVLALIKALPQDRQVKVLHKAREKMAAVAEKMKVMDI